LLRVELYTPIAEWYGLSKGVFERQEGGQVAIDTKKSVARAKPDSRASGGRGGQATAKRHSEPPAAQAKKRAKSMPPPAASAAANDNDRAPKKVPPSAKGPATTKAAASPMGRGRLPTGSLHTEARTPQHAESLKQRLSALLTAQQKLAELKRSPNKNFYEIGSFLHRIREDRLYEVKGYGSFEAFLERELSLGQQYCMTAVRIFEVFQPTAATALGLARLSAAIRALDEEPTGVSGGDAIRAARSPIPPHKL
jgi:hypothetical protein